MLIRPYFSINIVNFLTFQLKVTRGDWQPHLQRAHKPYAIRDGPFCRQINPNEFRNGPSLIAITSQTDGNAYGGCPLKLPLGAEEAPKPPSDNVQGPPL